MGWAKVTRGELALGLEPVGVNRGYNMLRRVSLPAAHAGVYQRVMKTTNQPSIGRAAAHRGTSAALAAGITALACMALPTSAADDPEALAEEIGADQAALDELGQRLLRCLESGDRDAFAQTVLVNLEDMEGIFAKLPVEMRERMPEDRKPGSEAFSRMIGEQLEKSAESFDRLMAFAEERGIDLSGPLELAAVEHGGVGLQGTFATTDQVTVSFGTPAAGDETLAVALRECGLAERGWVVHRGVGWQDLPASMLDEEAKRTLLLEQARNEGKPLPAGLPAPEISFFRVADGGEEKLSDFLGKVVVLDFWASWCGPCQAPMAKMQTYAEEHPEWGDKVALVALSIDDTVEKAASHLAAKGWDKSHNVWAGEGGFQAAPPQTYGVRGIPTAYVIDQEGEIHKSGHPATMDIPAIVSGLLGE